MMAAGAAVRALRTRKKSKSFLACVAGAPYLVLMLQRLVACSEGLRADP
jgi:hypothetical protein